MNAESPNGFQERGKWWRWILVLPAFLVGSIGGGFVALQPIIFFSDIVAPDAGFWVPAAHLIQAFAMGFGGVWLTYKTAPWAKGRVALATALGISALATLSLMVGQASGNLVDQYDSTVVAILAGIVIAGAGWYAVWMRAK